MDNISFLPEEHWYPLAPFGIEHSFFMLHKETLIYTWMALGILMVGAVFGRWALKHPHTPSGYIVRSLTRTFMDLISESFGQVIVPYYYFITSLFLFIFVSNTLVLLPGLEEPTRDVNTTFAVGLLSFLYTQIETMRVHGLFGYIQEYIKWPLRVRPEGSWTVSEVLLYAPSRLIANLALGCIALPFEALSKCASVVSLSLRLFGNIFGGSVIVNVLQAGVSGSIFKQSLALLTGLNIIVGLFFGLFEAFIQAFVFTVLSLTYLSMGTKE